MKHKVKCEACKYQWEARVKLPKKCPLCQTWINKPVIKHENSKSHTA